MWHHKHLVYLRILKSLMAALYLFKKKDNIVSDISSKNHPPTLSKSARLVYHRKTDIPGSFIYLFIFGETLLD